MTILEFQRKTPHAEGPCKCQDCKHEWHGLTELKELHESDGWLECPKCGGFKGRFVYAHSLPLGTPYLLCYCGNEYFNVTKEGAYCPNCGKHQII